MKTIEFLPQIDKARYDPSHICDGFLSDEFIRYGGAGAILAKNIAVPNFRVNTNTLIVMKRPNTDAHIVPEELEPIARLAANHQYAHSENARSKIGFLVLRNPILEIGRSRIGQDWHGHALPTGLSTEKLKQSFAELSRQDLEDVKFNPDGMVCDYLFSSIEPTFYQNEAAHKDLKIKRKFRGLVPANTASIQSSRAPQNSLLFITSRVFHKAPDDADIAPESFGKERLMVDISYLPTFPD